MSFRTSLAVAIAMALPSLAAAQATTPETATDLDTVVVTGTRTAVTVDQSLAAVEVIDREEIERSQAHSLPDLLRGRAGINIANQGGLGKLSSVFLRGSESNHALVLIDGVRVGSATSGLVAFQDLPVELIERIEIVRGPRSSLYGSEAIGGVIQIFTKRDQAGYAPHFRIGAGSHNLREVSGGFGGRGERGWFGADYAHQSSDGINACRGAGFPIFAGCFTDEPDLDGYENNSVSLRGGYALTEQLDAEVQGLRAVGHNDYDGFYNSSRTTQQVVGGKLRWQAAERVSLQLNAGRNTDASDNYSDDAFQGFFGSDRDSASLQGDFGFGKEQLVTLGFDWVRDRVNSDTDFDITRRHNRAGFAQYQGSFGQHDIQLSARYDDNEQFGSHTTGGIGWGFDFGHGLRLTANAGTAFTAPTFNDLYFPPFFGFPTANPKLLPEESESYELGLAQKLAQWHWQLNAYQTDIDNLIGLDDNFVPQNIARARIRGAELVVGATLAGWNLNTQLSHVDPRNTADFSDDKLLPRRARNTARIDLDRGFGDFRAGLTWMAEGERYDDLANTRRLPGYATVDLRLEYAVSPAWTLQARASNVLDREYETVAFYNQPGREYGLSLRYAPKR